MAAAGPLGGPKRDENGRKTQEFSLKLPDEVASGTYANALFVQHSREEFVMDFSMMVGKAGMVVSRVVTSPGHMKRIIAALEENVRKYEAAHGPIKTPDGPPPSIMGFPPRFSGEN